MDMRQFIHQSIIDIVGAVAAAQKDVSGLGARVNPATHRYHNSGEPMVAEGMKHGSGESVAGLWHPTEIQFDVAVSATDETTKEGGGKLRVASLSFGGRAAAKSEQERVSRIKFSIPIALPLQRSEV